MISVQSLVVWQREQGASTCSLGSSQAWQLEQAAKPSWLKEMVCQSAVAWQGEH